MTWTATNPVSTGNSTKKSDYDDVFDNTEFLHGLINIGLTASVGSKALTVSLKGIDGNNPSATNSVGIIFRSSTLTTGTPLLRIVTGALSVVLSSRSTLGFTAALAGRIYVWAIDNAGTVELALSRTADIYPEGNLVTTTAEGGAGAADSAAIMYSTTARSNVACRCIGYVEITTGGTAGEWDNAPTKIQVMGPGVRRTGDMVQTSFYQTGSYATGSTFLPFDATIPQITEGDEIMTLSITPTSPINKFEIIANVLYSVGVAGGLTIALFKDADANALAATGTTPVAVYANTNILRHIMITGGTSSITFRVRIGSGGGAGSRTWYLNAYGINELYGGTGNSTLTVKEIFA